MSTGYPTQELGRIARFEYGKSQTAVRSLDGTIPVYGTGGLMEYANTFLHPGPSVIVGRKGSLGNPLYSDGPFWAVDTTYYAAENNGSMRWLHYVLCSLRLENYNEATGVPSLARPTLNGIRVPFPSSDEQDGIVRILTTIDRAIEQTEGLLAKQQRIKTGLMHDLLTRGLDAQGRLRDPSTHRFKDSPLGRTPEDWDTPSLIEHADVMGGKRLLSGHKYSEGETGYLYLRVTDFFQRHPVSESMQRLEPATFAALQRYEIKDGDLYISIAGSLGYTGVFRNFSSYRVILTENAARIRIRSGFDPDYLSAQINGPLVQPQIDAEAGVGSGVPKLALYRIAGLRVPRPSETEQTEIVKRLHALNSPISDSERILGKLHRLKCGLMDDLLTGRVPVTPLLPKPKTPISS